LKTKAKQSHHHYLLERHCLPSFILVTRTQSYIYSKWISSPGRKIKVYNSIIKFHSQRRGLQHHSHSFVHIKKNVLLNQLNHTVALHQLSQTSPLRAASRAPCPPAYRSQNAHRYLPAKREGYSASPVAPRAAKGPHKNQS